MHRLSLMGLLAMLLAAGGCDASRYMLYVLSPGQSKETVKAEFAGLQGKTVAVVVYADMNTQLEYPAARLGLADKVCRELTKQVKDAKTIDPKRVLRYQEENLHWDAMPRQDLARELKADYVLYISLSEYSTHEPGSVALAQGRISAQTSVWDSSADPGTDPCVWRKPSVSVTWPPDQPMGAAATSEGAVQFATEQLFAEELVKFFYDHKVEKKS